MSTDSDYANDDDALWEKIDEGLDRMSIPEQIAGFEEHINAATLNVIQANALAKKICNAIDVLTEDEPEKFLATLLKRMRDLQALLVLQTSGRRQDREILELLYLIYYPRIGPDGGLALSLDDHLFQGRTGHL